MNASISISIVIYNSKEQDLRELFSSYANSLSFAKSKDAIQSSHVYVVDNNPASPQKMLIDKLCQQYKLNYTYLLSQENGGYGHGHNKVINSSINSDFHIICNPDIVFYSDTLNNAINFLSSSPQTVLLTPAVFGVDGEQHYLCKKNPTLLHLLLRRFCPNYLKKKLFHSYLASFEYRDHSYSTIIKDVPFCTGCFMFFKTAVLKKLKGFDERFFLYMEDADLSRRALAIGETTYVPAVKVIHRWERGSYKSTILRNLAIKSALKYWRKWGGIY